MAVGKVHGLGEVAIRCADLEAMWAFYRDVAGLAPLRAPDADGIGFFALGEGHGGHTTVLALFPADAGRAELFGTTGARPATGPASSLHHLALTVDADDQPTLMARFERLGLAPRMQVFGWIGWRGVFIRDPEGNTVEFVAADPAFRDARPATG